MKSTNSLSCQKANEVLFLLFFSKWRVMWIIFEHPDRRQRAACCSVVMPLNVYLYRQILFDRNKNIFANACDKSASGTWYIVMRTDAWPTTLNLVLSNSQSWLSSFASRRSQEVECEGVAGPCDTQTVQTCFSACCSSSYSTKQWLRDAIIDTISVVMMIATHYTSVSPQQWR